MELQIKQPKVSILTTAYNRKNYISQAIESVLNSTFRDFELIIVDDCSTDSTYEIIKDWAKKDNRIRAYRNEVNLGDYPNRNKAASYATGIYIKYLDSDDILYPHSLDVMVQTMERFRDAAFGLSFNIIDPPQPFPFMLDPHQAFHQNFLIKGIFGVGPSASIIRSDVFHSMGGFSTAQYISDTKLWLSIASKHSVVLFQPALVWRSKHEDQQITFELKDYNILHQRFIQKLNILQSQDCPLLGAEKSKAVDKIRYYYSRNILNIGLKQYKWCIAYKLYKKSGLTFINLLKSLISKP